MQVKVWSESKKARASENFVTLIMVMLAVSISSCQRHSVRADVEEPELVQVVPSGPIEPVQSQEIPENEEFQSDIKDFEVYNSNVKKWENYFTGRGRKHMKRYLQRSGRYVPLMKKIFAQYGLSPDLVYLAMIESGFSSKATSHASAVGYWQFIKGTGKRYGLKIDYYIDERRDPVLATHAAAKYLKGLYHVFGSWPLALASYNTGENRVKRAVMKRYTRDYWELVEMKAIPRETRDYVGKYIAALRIARQPQKYGFDVEYEDSLFFDQIQVKHAVNLRVMARKMGLSLSKLKRYNPAVKYNYIPYSRKGFKVNVPKGMLQEAVVAARASKSSRPKYSQPTYVVRRGDTLSHIAKRTGTSVRKLIQWNSLNRRGTIRVGQKLRVGQARVAAVKTRKSKPTERLRNAASKKRPTKVHIVRRGETLSSIAQRYSVSVGKLAQANKINNRGRIYVGSQLMIPN